MQAGLAQALDQADDQERMPTQFEEMIVAAHPFDPQQFLPGTCQGVFDRPQRGFVMLAGGGGCIRRRQGIAVQLAVGGQRPGRQGHERAGQHVFGQHARQLAAQGGRLRDDPVMGDQVGHQALVAGLVFAHGDQGFADFGTGQQLGLDFSQFDAETADLDL